MILSQPSSRSLPATPSSQTSFTPQRRPLPTPPHTKDAFNCWDSRPSTSRRADTYDDTPKPQATRVARPPPTSFTPLPPASRPRPLPRPGAQGLLQPLTRSWSTPDSVTHTPPRPTMTREQSRIKHRPTRSAETYSSARRLVVLNPDQTDDSDGEGGHRSVQEKKSAPPGRANREENQSARSAAADGVNGGAVKQSKWYIEKNGKRVTQSPSDYPKILVTLRRLRTSKS